MIQPIEKNIRPIPQNRLDIKNKKRSNLFAWRGQFSPQLAEVLLSEYCPKNAIVFDPFVGCGTVLYESARLGYESYGVEINPAAYQMAKVFELINTPLSRRLQELKNVDDILSTKIGCSFPLFNEIDENNGGTNLDFLKSLVFFAKNDIQKILLKALVILLDISTATTRENWIWSKWNDFKILVTNLPYSEKIIKPYHADARNLPLEDNCIDLVVTSPPYINVFNYHQQYRASAELLGWNLLHVAKSEIGSNRKYRQNRFFTVVQYCLDMNLVFSELARVCKKNAHVIFVVGRESNIRRTAFHNSEIIKKLGEWCFQFDVPLQQERLFKNRFGQMIYEDILHFVIRKNHSAGNYTPQKIAEDCLKEALLSASEDTRSDIENAIVSMDMVKPSPFFCMENIRG